MAPPRRPAAEALIGAGVFYGAAGSEARAMEGRNVCVVGGGNSAGQAAMHLAQYAKSVTLLVRGTSLAPSMSEYLIRELTAKPNVDVRLGVEVADGAGEERLEAVIVRDRSRGATERIPASGLFVMIGAEPRTEWLDGIVGRDPAGYLLTGFELMRDAGSSLACPLGRPPMLLETSAPGVFAAGDVRCGSTKRVASAVGEGAMAVQLVHQYLVEQASARPRTVA